MKENLLRKLYVDELKDLYSAENQLVKALPEMAKAATARRRRKAGRGGNAIERTDRTGSQTIRVIVRVCSGLHRYGKPRSSIYMAGQSLRGAG